VTNPPKKKGTAAEVAVIAFLRANGFPRAERRALAGTQDRGDVAGIPGVVIEIKNHQTAQLAAWIDEALRESGADTPDYELGVVWHKRARKGSPGDWYISMDAWTFLDFLKAYFK
jgi:hypothetical protein